MSDMVVQKKPAPQKQVIRLAEKPRESFREPVYVRNNTREQLRGSSPIAADSFKKRAGGLVFWIISLVGIVAIIVTVAGFFASAQIIITPKAFSGNIDTVLTFNQTETTTTVPFAAATKVFTETKIIPATTFTTQDTKATGTVRIYNTGAISQALKKGAIITGSNGKQYVFNTKVVIPKATGKVPGQVDVGVTALDSGQDYNEAQDDFTLINASAALQKLITIHSITALSGGAKGQMGVPDPGVLAQTTQDLSGAFPDTPTLTKRIADELPDDVLMLPILFPTSTPTITTDGSSSDGVQVTATEAITILLVHKEDIAQALGKLVGADPSLRLTMSSFDGLTMSTAALVSATTIPSQIQVRVSGTPHIVGFIDTNQIEEHVLGLSRSDTREYLTAIPEIGSFRLKISPFWRSMVPNKKEDVAVSLASTTP